MAVELVDDNDVETRVDPTMPMAPNAIRRLALAQLSPGRARRAATPIQATGQP